MTESSATADDFNLNFLLDDDDDDDDAVADSGVARPADGHPVPSDGGGGAATAHNPATLSSLGFPDFTSEAFGGVSAFFPDAACAADGAPSATDTQPTKEDSGQNRGTEEKTEAAQSGPIRGPAASPGTAGSQLRPDTDEAFAFLFENDFTSDFIAAATAAAASDKQTGKTARAAGAAAACEAAASAQPLAADATKEGVKKSKEEAVAEGLEARTQSLSKDSGKTPLSQPTPDGDTSSVPERHCQQANPLNASPPAAARSGGIPPSPATTTAGDAPKPAPALSHKSVKVVAPLESQHPAAPAATAVTPQEPIPNASPSSSSAPAHSRLCPPPPGAAAAAAAAPSSLSSKSSETEVQDVLHAARHLLSNSDATMAAQRMGSHGSLNAVAVGGGRKRDRDVANGASDAVFTAQCAHLQRRAETARSDSLQQVAALQKRTTEVLALMAPHAGLASLLNTPGCASSEYARTPVVHLLPMICRLMEGLLAEG